MKMVKSLILGTAVAFAASAGAQAADLPVKAKAAGYVKICPQYGPGFYYIPGTDICLKVGGLVFAEAGYYVSGAITNLSYGANGWDHTDNALAWRTRGYISMDARTATPYGVLRSFILGGLQQVSGTTASVAGVTNSGFLQYAFIQFAGFTAGTCSLTRRTWVTVSRRRSRSKIRPGPALMSLRRPTHRMRRTSSLTSVSTRLGAQLRSWLLPSRLVGLTVMIGASRLVLVLKSSSRCWALATLSRSLL